MTVLVWLVVGMLLLKLVWNLSVPFVLLKRSLSSPGERTSSISMATPIEIVLLLVAVLLSAMSSGESPVNRPLAVAGWGGAAIAFTYIHLVAVGTVGGWVLHRKSSG